MKIQQVMCGVLALSLMGGSLHVPMAQAAMVGTEQVVASATQQQAVNEARERLTAMLARKDVATQLQGHGVELEQALARVDSLTDAEVLQLAGQLDQLPAGGDSVVGAILIVFLVLLITDILGYTDIFPFVKK